MIPLAAPDDTVPAVSVIVVSNGRPQLLCRCVAAMVTLLHPHFEVIVVADGAGLDALEAAGLAGRLKLARLDVANISAARNAGIGLAAAPVVAFIDDDAVPRPDWLLHLSRVFENPAVAAAGGYVIGRNGFSWQWRARQVDPTGKAADLPHQGDGPRIYAPDDPALRPEHAVKLEGTNCAFRREVLLALGGFDEGFRFYLDETDLCLRLARAGHTIAVVPRAVVHHAYAPSARRRADRVPLSLTEIGASSARFLMKHAPERKAAALTELRREQAARLEEHAAAGRLTRERRAALITSLEDGISDADTRPAPSPVTWPAPPPFRAYEAWPPGGLQIVAGRPWQRRRKAAHAARLAQQGQRVLLVILSPIPRRHRRWFDIRGFWVQEGGIFARSEREGPFPRPKRFKARVTEEAQAFATGPFAGPHPDEVLDPQASRRDNPGALEF